jgi:hypothetical protein
VTERALPAPSIDGFGGVAAGDFDGDGSVDLASADEVGAVEVLHNDGRGGLTAGAGTQLSPALVPNGEVVSGDLDGNGRADLVVTGREVVDELRLDRPSHGGVAVLSSDGTGWEAHGPLFLDDGQQPRDLAVGDLDGDGNAEVVVLDGRTAVVLWDRNGELERGPRLEAPPETGFGLGQWRLALADVDRDGRTDVVTWTVKYPGRPLFVILHRNTGSGTFASSVMTTIDDASFNLAVADFDGDGDPDVMAIGSRHRLHIRVNRGDGTFDGRTQLRKTGGGDLVAADVDADGRQDLVVSVPYSSGDPTYPGDLRVRLNLGGWRFSDPERLARPRTLLAVADLTGDRRADFLVTTATGVVALISRDCRPTVSD